MPETTRWTVWACPTCKRQSDELDGLHCDDHEPSAEFEEVVVVAAAAPIKGADMTGHRFAQILRGKLESTEMSQSSLGARLGVTQTAVSYWVNDMREPDLTTVCRIADIFEVSVDHMLGREAEAIDHIERLRQIANEQKRLADELVTLYGPIEILTHA